mmetsp:Transcript_9158/g.19616  ORF Transcript_9158/g.19616 Transcript_9158/m.19616 type:complete len:257 (+) Transcript_9158:292-1062(+)
MNSCGAVQNIARQYTEFANTTHKSTELLSRRRATSLHPILNFCTSNNDKMTNIRCVGFILDVAHCRLLSLATRSSVSSGLAVESDSWATSLSTSLSTSLISEGSTDRLSPTARASASSAAIRRNCILALSDWLSMLPGVGKVSDAIVSDLNSSSSPASGGSTAPSTSSVAIPLLGSLSMCKVLTSSDAMLPMSSASGKAAPRSCITFSATPSRFSCLSFFLRRRNSKRFAFSSSAFSACSFSSFCLTVLSGCTYVR